MKHKISLRLLTVLVALAMALCLAGCDVHEDPTEPNYDDFTNPTWAPVSVEEISTIVTDESIANLDKYPGLRKVDLSGSTCYAAIAAYIESHPEVEVIYSVSLGGVDISAQTSELILLPGAYDYDMLMTNLVYLPQVTRISLPKTELSLQQINAISEAYSQVTVEYTVEFNGVEYGKNTTELNLADYDPNQLENTLEKLAMMPYITHVELMKEDGTSAFTKEQVKQLQAAAPHITFHYVLELFGITVSTSDEIVDFSKCNIDSEESLREAMSILTKVSKVRVVGCDLSHETLAGIQADYPGTKLVWRVYVAGTPFLTDEETLFLSQSHLDDNNCSNLKYLTSAKYIDAGHSEELTDVSWLAYMPDVEILILSGSPIRDISAMAGCTKMDWLELTFCNYLSDISVVKNLTNLRYLNIGYTEVSDISALEDLPLVRFHALRTNVPNEDFKAFIEKHPDCWTTYYGSKQPYGKGWRYEDGGYTFSECYLRLREIFEYDKRG